MSDGLGSALNTINRNVVDLHNMAAKSFNTIGSELDVIDGNVDAVQNNVKLINSEISKLRKDFEAFVAKDEKEKAKQFALTNVGVLRDKLKDQFGHHENARKHLIGILQADDLELVRKETIETVTEEIMLATPGYWLPPCLLAISNWLSDKKDMVEKALKEAINRDDEKTSLLFALICRRANRQQACLKWISRYLANQHEERLNRNAIVILDAFACGLLGNDTEGVVEAQLQEWLMRLKAKAGFEQQQIVQWSEAINLKRKPYSGKYEYLPKYSKTYPTLQYIMEGAYLHNTIFNYFDNIFKQQASGLELKEQLDEILDSLAHDFDVEELPLRQDYQEMELILKHEGDKERARREMEVYKSGYDTHKDFTQLLTDAAMKPEVSKSSVSTQKFALALTKIWINKAYRNIIEKNRAAKPTSIEINIDDFNDKTTDGKNEAELISKMDGIVESKRHREHSANVLTGFQQFCLYGGVVFSIIGLFLLILVSGGVYKFLGLLFLGFGIGWTINHFSKKNAIEKNKVAINNKYNRIKNDAQVILRGTLAEVVDILDEFERKDAESKKVLDFIDQIRAGEVIQQVDEDTALSKSLPIWNIEPPEVAVRRKKLTAE